MTDACIVRMQGHCGVMRMRTAVLCTNVRLHVCRTILCGVQICLVNDQCCLIESQSAVLHFSVYKLCLKFPHLHPPPCVILDSHTGNVKKNRGVIAFHVVQQYVNDKIQMWKHVLCLAIHRLLKGLVPLLYWQYTCTNTCTYRQLEAHAPRQLTSRFVL